MGAGVEQADFLNQPHHAVQCCQVTALVEKMSFLSSLLYLSHVFINSCINHFLAPAMDPSLFSVPGMQWQTRQPRSLPSSRLCPGERNHQ